MLHDEWDIPFFHTPAKHNINFKAQIIVEKEAEVIIIWRNTFAITYVSKMALVTLLVDNQVIETRLFPNAHLKIEGYLQGLKYDMLERNNDILDSMKAIPEFRVEVPKRKIIYN